MSDYVKSPPVSVVMAACNGLPYIREQIDSILRQLDDQDELVISLDPSTDGTEQLLERMRLNDSRIVLVKGPGQGPLANFENGLKAASCPVIFLSDQDDVWLPDKKRIMLEALANKHVLLAVHDAATADAHLQIIDPSFFASRPLKKDFKSNVIKNCFMGCCMAFKKDLLEEALPFPKKIPMHDQWLGLIALENGRVAFVEKPLIYYRRHEDNVSSIQPSNLLQQLSWRFHLLQALQKHKSSSKNVKNHQK